MDDRRRDTRFTLPAGYSPIEVRLLDRPGEDLHGHAYNISASGLRFELDSALPAGARIAVRLELPGQRGAGLQASGVSGAGRPASMIEALPNPAVYAIATVIWLIDEADEPGPVRMGARFEGFPRATDAARLRELIADGRYAAVA